MGDDLGVAGVVDENVQATERLKGCIDKTGALLLTAHVCTVVTG